MTVLYASFMTFLQIPLMELLLSHFFLSFEGTSKSIKMCIYILASMDFIFFLSMTAFLFKLYIIRIPCSSIPWSASNTQLHFMKLINKLLLVVGHLYHSAFGEALLVL